MAGRYQGYPVYKYSGHKFVGCIPIGWTRKIVGAISDVIDPQPDHRAPAICNDGEGFPYIGIRDVNIDGTLNFDTARPVEEEAVIKQEKSFTIEPNNILFCKVGTLGIPRKVIPNGRCALSATLVLIKVKAEFNSQYFLYALDSDVVTSQTNYLATGSTRAALGIQQIRKFQIPFPDDFEQQKIADFLDHETAKIDTLIAKQQQLIALLKEKRQAVISHAVTKGLNPNAPMRDSGVEWLGEVPAHWDVKPLKHIVIEPLMYGANEAAVDVNTENVRFVRITDVREDGSLREETFRSLDDVLAEPYLLAQGDVLLARTGGTVGKSFIYDESWGRCCFAGYLIKARIDEKKAKAEWFYQYTSTKYYWEWIASNQIKATLPNVSADKYNGFVLAIPPVFEQVEILEKLKLDVEKLDYLVKKAELAIELMQERLTALISAAVTGKIDVRDWQAPESLAQVEQEVSA